MNQGPAPQGQPRPSMPQGRRPRPGAAGGAPRPRPGAPRPPQGDVEWEEGMPAPKKSGGDGKTWAIAIVITLLLIGGSVFMFIKQGKDQAEADAKAQLPAAFGNIMRGNFEDDYVTNSNMLADVSEAEQEIIKAAATAKFNVNIPGLKPAMTVEGESLRYAEELARSNSSREKFFDETFTLLTEIQMEVADAASSNNDDSIEETLIEAEAADFRVRMCLHALDNLDTSAEDSMINSFYELIKKEIAGFSEATQKARYRKTREVKFTAPYEAIKKGTADSKVVNEFMFYHWALKMTANKVYSIAQIDGSPFESAEKAEAKKYLSMKVGAGSKNFDELLSGWQKQLEDQVRALDKKFSKKVNDAVNERREERVKALDEMRDSVNDYIKKKEAARPILTALADRHNLSNKESITELFNNLSKGIEAAKNKRTEILQAKGQ